MAKKKRVLFIYQFLSSFIEKDLNILKEEFEVIPFQYRGKKDLFRLLKNVLSTELNVSWFCLGYATSAVLFSKLFGKKSVIIAGGWDVVSIPEIGYGAMIGKKRIRKTRFALKRANKIITVSESMQNWILKWVKRDDIIILYHGFDFTKFVPKGTKEDLVVSVGNLTYDVTIRVKGIDTFVKAAELLPDIKFVLIGRHNQKILENLRAKAPPNLEIIDFIPQERLIDYYQKAKIYAQLSYQESFGCALAEAMLCECVPVVTRKGAIPEVVGDIGFYVDYGDVKDTAKKIKDGLISDKGSDARKRIMTLFSLEERKKKLTKVLNDCLK